MVNKHNFSFCQMIKEFQNVNKHSYGFEIRCEITQSKQVWWISKFPLKSFHPNGFIVIGPIWLWNLYPWEQIIVIFLFFSSPVISLVSSTICFQAYTLLVNTFRREAARVSIIPSTRLSKTRLRLLRGQIKERGKGMVLLECFLGSL